MMIANPRESCTHDGAVRLAEEIRRFWVYRGYLVEVGVEQVCTAKEGGFNNVVWGVRSNLVGGLPPPGSEMMSIQLRAAE